MMKNILLSIFIFTISAVASTTQCPIQSGTYLPDNKHFPKAEFKCHQFHGSVSEMFIKGTIEPCPRMYFRHMKGNLWSYYSSIIPNCSPTYLYPQTRTKLLLEFKGEKVLYSLE